MRIAGGATNVAVNFLRIGLEQVTEILINLLLITIPEATLLVSLLLWMRYRAPRVAEKLNVSLLENEIEAGAEIKLVVSEFGKGGSNLIS